MQPARAALRLQRPVDFTFCAGYFPPSGLFAGDEDVLAGAGALVFVPAGALLLLCVASPPVAGEEVSDGAAVAAGDGCCGEDEGSGSFSRVIFPQSCLQTSSQKEPR